MIDKIKELVEETGASIIICMKALDYSDGDKETAIAYIKAKSFAVSTPFLTFHERVQSFKMNCKGGPL